MKKVLKLLLFLVGAFLFLTSLPLSTKIIMELIHNQKMDAAYEITNVSTGSPPTESTFHFKDHIIETEETAKIENSHRDPQSRKMSIADLSLKIDGEELDKLKDYPVRMEDVGLNRYYGEIAYLTLEDKSNDKTQFIILLKKTREVEKETPDGDIAGSVPDKKLQYTAHILDENGSIDKTSFSFSERDALQTELLIASSLAPYPIGYYTDALESIPTILFLFLFPFVTLAAGFILLILSLLIRKGENQNRKA
ncbi:hypothetical protein [Oceanobacillus neutriphilus]|uniref:Uncharacterized protein n=1 Tax=Oceanobacillus neutriphilus TaxID=531815 RepID=A0ABQ2NTK2_9BACI|nr:hypothetical protein [Oceanobacillus neutriphilus]GGP08197.1 hypothetical protein GCM10011346_07280 [Oceanobacillus neutriphilus]